MVVIYLKKNIFLLVLCAFVVGCFAIVLLITVFLQSKNSVEISGNVIENQNYNYNLLRIDDKLYYNYEKSQSNHGLIEISEKSSKKIFWNGYHPLASPRKLLSIIKNYDDKLVTANDNGDILVYNYITKKVEEHEYLNSIPGISMYFQQVGDEIVYSVYNASKDSDTVFIYNESSREVIAENVVTDFVVVGNDIYYAKNGADESREELRRYNISNKTDDLIAYLVDYFVYSIYVENNTVVFNACNGVYKINLNSSSKAVDTIYEDAGACVYATYNNKAYIVKDNRLVCHDLVSSKNTELCNSYAEECYIVDDMWIYFRGKNSSLWRVTQDGSIVERVYG